MLSKKYFFNLKTTLDVVLLSLVIFSSRCTKNGCTKNSSKSTSKNNLKYGYDFKKSFNYREDIKLNDSTKIIYYYDSPLDSCYSYLDFYDKSYVIEEIKTLRGIKINQTKATWQHIKSIKDKNDWKLKSYEYNGSGSLGW